MFKQMNTGCVIGNQTHFLLKTMKNYLALLFLPIILFVSGCAPTPEEQKQIDAFNASQLKAGTHIGTLPDGRPITCYELKYQYNIHYVYVVPATTTITSNQPSGKTRRTVVTIDGIDYAPVEKLE
jgi:hypothetical protein